MMKSSDEIKKGLECDPLALIRQLHADNCRLTDELYNAYNVQNEQLVRINQLEAERDAAVNALRLVQEKHEIADEVIDNEVFPLVDYDVYRRLRDTVDDMMSWEIESDSRGVQKEE